MSELHNMKLPTVCEGCLEIIRRPSQVGNVERVLCVACEIERKALENDECIICKGKGVKKGYWGQCQECWDKSIQRRE